MAQRCPVIDPLRPPSIGRELPGVFQFGAVCLPGTATSAGCAPEQRYYAIQVPWNTFVTDGWVAPGGNRYWSKTVPEGSPEGLTVLRLMADVSKNQFRRTFKRDSLKNKPMGRVLAEYPDWVADYGNLHVEVRPDPNETAGAFIARGGYLLWVSGALQTQKSKVLDSYIPAWLPRDKIKYAQLWGGYKADRLSVEYVIRLVFEGTWDSITRATFGNLGKATKKFCEGVTNEKVAAATIAATTLYPAAAPYAAVWAAAAGVCNVNALPCELPVGTPPPPANPTLPTVGSGVTVSTPPPASTSVKANTIWATDAGRQYAATATTIVQSYPEGTIAWYDSAAGGYRTAIPAPGPGVTHRVLSNVTAALPRGARPVNKTDWERATLPWWRRTHTKIGMVIGGVAAAGAATVFAAARR